jgi:hypothetical protein
MPKFRRAFAANPSPRLDTAPLREIAEKIVYVCATPMYDNVMDQPDLFEKRVEEVLADYDPEFDIIVDYGDPLVFALMVYFLSDDKIKIARYSRRDDNYSIKEVTQWWN